MANENAPTTAEPVVWKVLQTEHGHCLTIRVYSLEDPGTVTVKIKSVDERVTPPKQTDVPDPTVTLERTEPWIHHAQDFFRTGITKATVQVLAGGKPFWGPTEIPLGVPVPATAGGADVVVPRLAQAINSTEQVKPDAVSAIDAAFLNQLLKHIWSRLSAPMDAAWLGPHGTKGLPPDVDDTFIGDPWAAPEEAWAQAHTEMFFAVPYQSSGAFHLSDSAKDRDIFAKMQNKDDPAHPLAAACQQLCSLAAITRGVPITGGGIDCALYRFPGPTPTDPDTGSQVQNPNKGIFSAFQGSWLDPGNTNVASVSPPLEPGSMFMFAKEPGTNWVMPADPTKKPPAIRSPGMPHIAFVIRVRPPAHAQFFDTGAISPAKRSAEDRARFPVSGILDYQPIPDVGGPGPFRGIGVLPKPTRDGLAARVSWMRTVRPLGMARLVIHELSGGTKGRTLLMTPLLRMHSGTLCFPISRYLWSLRELPGASLVCAEWWIYGSRGKLAKVEVANNTRALSIDQLIKDHSVTLDGAALAGIVLASSETDGQVSIPGTYDYQASNGWKGKAMAILPAQTMPPWSTFWLSSDHESQRSTILSDLPTYYTADWPTTT